MTLLVVDRTIREMTLCGEVIRQRNDTMERVIRQRNNNVERTSEIVFPTEQGVIRQRNDTANRVIIQRNDNVERVIRQRNDTHACGIPTHKLNDTGDTTYPTVGEQRIFSAQQITHTHKNDQITLPFNCYKTALRTSAMTPADA